MSGSTWERELVARLHDLGWFAQRAGASGSATTRPLPDVLAARRFPDGTSVAWAIELKTSNQDYNVYLDPEEIADLYDIEARSGFAPRIAVRWKRDTNVYLRRPDESCYYTDAGNLRVQAHERADWPGEILRKPKDGGFTNTDFPTASEPVTVVPDYDAMPGPVVEALTTGGLG